MNQEPTIRYTRVRKVKPLVRANAGDAGLDFYCPEDLTIKQLMACQPEGVINSYGIEVLFQEGNIQCSYRLGTDKVLFDTTGKSHWRPFTPLYEDYQITDIIVGPQSRVLIPSGIKVLLTPQNSMFMAANKSGISTKQGLIYGAEIVDSPYTGEVHLSIINTSRKEQVIQSGKKVEQFIHVPIFLSEPEEIPNQLYEEVAKNWGTRGAKAFGSSDDQLAGGNPQQPELSLDYEDELAIRDAQFSN